MTYNEQCAICDELLDERTAGLYHEYARKNGSVPESRILYRNAKFAVMPSLGPLAECHLLVVPIQHVCSYSALDEKELCIAEEIIDNVAGFVRKKFGSSLIFEHGTMEAGMKGSASCVHAHMHIVSCPESICGPLIKDNLEMRRITKLSELKEQIKRKKPYFYYREGTGEAYLMDDTIQKSQYLRILIANILGNPQKGDWKKNHGIDELERMMKKIKENTEWNEFNRSSR